LVARTKAQHAHRTLDRTIGTISMMLSRCYAVTEFSSLKQEKTKMMRSLLTALALFVLPAFSLSMKSPKAEWIGLTPSSKIEPPRSGHVAFTAKDRLFIFGGYAEDEDMNRYVTNDLWEWAAGEWKKQEPVGEAHPRLVSSAVVLKDWYDRAL
jgi:hypothetical protein